MDRDSKALWAVKYAADLLHDEVAAAIDAAFDEFVDYIDPAALYRTRPSERDFMAIEMCFSEWLITERPLRRGLSPLQLAAATPPSDAPGETADLLREVASSQFFSRFAIESKDREQGAATLVDVRTGERYEVLAPRICAIEHWSDGSIALRIARAGGRWQEAGRVNLYDRCAPGPVTEESAGEIHPEDGELPEALRSSYYLRLVRDLMGIDGHYRSTARIVGAVA